MSSSIKPPTRSKASKSSVSASSNGPISSTLNTARAKSPARNAPDASPSQSQRRLTLESNGRRATVEPPTARSEPVDIITRPANSTLGPAILIERIMATRRSSFSTNELRSWHDPRSQNSKTFTTNYPADVFPIGINLIDVERGHNVRLKAFADNVRPSEAGSYHKFKAEFHLDAWADTRLFAAGCCWFDVSKHSRDFQFGTFKIARRLVNDEAVLDVKFKGQYVHNPQIVVWLSAIDIDKSQPSRIEAFASNITTKGFELCVGTWENTVIHGATVSWIAVPSDRPNITAGQLRFEGDGSASERIERITFDGRFTFTPRVLLALNALDVSNNHNLRIEAKAEDITRNGMTLSIKSWEDTILFGAGIAYIAIEELPPVD